MRRLLAILLWLLAVLGYDRDVVLAPERGHLRAGMLPSVPDQLQQFYDFAASRIPPGHTISLLLPPHEWNSGYAYPYFRASYSLPTETVIPVITEKHFYAFGGIDTNWLKFPDPLVVAHPDYPPLVPAMMAASAILAGHWDDTAIRILFVIVGVALLLILVGELADQLANHATILAIIFIGVSLSPWTGLADGPFAAFLSSSVLMARRGFRSGNSRVLWLAGFLLGCAALSKNEGIALIVSVGLAALLTGIGPRRIAQLWPGAVLIAAWIAYRAAIGLHTDLFAPGVLGRVLHNFPLLLSGIQRALVVTPSGLLIIAAAAACIARPAVLRQERFIALTTAIQIGLYWAAYLTTPYTLADHVANSWGRLAEHVIPLMAWITALAIGEIARSGDRYSSPRSEGSCAASHMR